MLIGGCYVSPVSDLIERATDQHYDSRQLSAIDTAVIHHVGGSERDYSAQEIAVYHVRSRGWPGIGYHFIIHPDGRIEQTNHLTTVSWHAGKWNGHTVGILLAGTFNRLQPTPRATSRCRQLIQSLERELGRSLVILGHRDLRNTGYGPTECPGNTWDSWRGRLYTRTPSPVGAK